MFIDNHVSNGADYQYVLTHLMTQHNKLGGQLGTYLKNSFQPALEKKLSEKDWPITPYVNVFNRSPDDGFSQFFDSPRYSTGYTTLFNTMGMMLETHMLKPYKKRVLGTYAFMQTVIHLADKDAKKIKKFRRQAFENYQTGDNYPIQWQIDDEKFSNLEFLGYQANTVTSEVTGLDRLKYNRQQPFRKKIKYKDSYKPSISVRIPKAYIIPQGWHRVISLLTLNQIHMRQLEKETTWDVEVYRIEDYTTNKNVYEGHYPHKTVTISRSTQQVTFRAGDYYIATDQPGVRYLLEVLEPEATDSFFKWNFFDTVLSQKEGFSPYVWEDHALHLLAENPALKESFNSKKTSDPQFAHNAYQQLQWLHRKSKHYEKAHLNYPVYRLP